MATYHEVRPDILDSIRRYAEHGVPTGSFLRAVLENDLREAFGRADDDNREAMFHIVRFCWNEIPGDCWGTPARVKAWIDKHAEARKLAQQ